MITPFLDAGYWFIDAGLGETHRERSHKTVFMNEWEITKDDSTLRKRNMRKHKKKHRTVNLRIRRTTKLSE